MFLDELLDIPPEREIDFSIYLLLNTQHITIPPYNMAPTELKKLLDQLKDLLDKDFIRLATSPWGAPVFFFKRRMFLFVCASITDN